MIRVNSQPRGDSGGRLGQAKLIQDSSIFSVALVVASVCGIIRSFVLAKLLGPGAFGTWRFINIFAEGLHLASLGTQPALHRWIPFLRSKGDTEQLNRVVGTASTINFYCSLIYGGVVFLWSFFVSEASYGAALAAFAPVIVLLVWLTYGFGISTDFGLHQIRSCLEVVHAVLTLIFSLLLIGAFGVYGAIYGLGLAALVTNAISYKGLRGYYFFSKPDIATIKLLVVTGLPILADIILPITMSNVDRILIAAMLTPEHLGIYSIGNAAVTILAMVPSALGQILFVKFAEMHGQNRTTESIAEAIEKTTIVLASIIAPVLAAAIVMFPPFVVLFLPEYADGIAAGRLLIASVFFLAISIPASKWCVSTGKHRPVLILRVGVIMVYSGVAYFVIALGGTLELIALVTLLAFCAFSVSVGVICHSVLNTGACVGLLRTGQGIFPFLTVFCVMMVQDTIYGMPKYVAGARLYWSCAAAGIVACILSGIFFYRLDRRIGIKKLVLSSW